MVVSKLVYDGQIIGFRFSEIPYKEGILADMYCDVGKEVLNKFERCIDHLGNDVSIKLINGRYISNNEQDAVEILSYDEWVGFFYCNQTVVSNVYERSGIARSSNGGGSCFICWNGVEDVIGDIEKYPNIKQLEDRLRAMSNFAICNISCRPQSFKFQTDACIYMDFPNLLEFSKFIHEWYKYKTSIPISAVVRIDDYRNDFSVNTVKDIYNKLKSITHSKDGYVYPGSDWKDEDGYRPYPCRTHRPKDIIGEFYFYYNYSSDYGICVDLYIKLVSRGYEG